MAIGVLLAFDIRRIQISLDLVVLVYGEQVLNSAALRCAATLRYLVHLEPVAKSLLREEQHGRVHIGHIDMLYEIFLAHATALLAHAAA